MEEIVFIKYSASLEGQSPPSPMSVLLSQILPGPINHTRFPGLRFSLNSCGSEQLFPESVSWKLSGVLASVSVAPFPELQDVLC